MEKAIDAFTLDKRRLDGRASWCRDCRNEYQKQSRAGLRKCIDCKQVKSVSEFSSTRICNTCKSVKKCKVCGKRLPLTKFDGYHGLVCIDCRKKKDSERYFADKARILQKNKEWRANFAQPGSIYRQKERKKAKETLELRRDAVFNAYGGAVCSCCGETERKFLTVDHVNGNGNAHRAEIRQNIIDWLYRNNFPDGFQILCYNCNLGKQRNGGVCCPHKEIDRDG